MDKICICDYEIVFNLYGDNLENESDVVRLEREKMLYLRKGILVVF